jgi:hypothetical protein
MDGHKLDVPASLLAELVPTRPSPVDQSVYDTGPTARMMRRVIPAGFAVVQAAGERDERHVAAAGEHLTLCGLLVEIRFPMASILIVECDTCSAIT